MRISQLSVERWQPIFGALDIVSKSGCLLSPAKQNLPHLLTRSLTEGVPASYLTTSTRGDTVKSGSRLLRGCLPLLRISSEGL